MKTTNVVQFRSPKTGRYIKIDTVKDVIISHKKTNGPYKNVPILVEYTEWDDCINDGLDDDEWIKDLGDEWAKIDKLNDPTSSYDPIIVGITVTMLIIIIVILFGGLG